MMTTPYGREERHTPEDGINSDKVGSDRKDNHADSKGQELVDDIAVKFSQFCFSSRRGGMSGDGIM